MELKQILALAFVLAQTQYIKKYRYQCCQVLRRPFCYLDEQFRYLGKTHCYFKVL
jgi:hypothetical protein